MKLLPSYSQFTATPILLKMIQLKLTHHWAGKYINWANSISGQCLDIEYVCAVFPVVGWLCGGLRIISTTVAVPIFRHTVTLQCSHYSFTFLQLRSTALIWTPISLNISVN